MQKIEAMAMKQNRKKDIVNALVDSVSGQNWKERCSREN